MFNVSFTVCYHGSGNHLRTPVTRVQKYIARNAICWKSPFEPYAKTRGEDSLTFISRIATTYLATTCAARVTRIQKYIARKSIWLERSFEICKDSTRSS